MKGHVEGINSQGGFTVPDEFENELITLREQYGVFRRNARVVPMSSDVKRIPQRASTVTAYFVGEASAITESQQVFDQVQLVAKKLGVVTTISSELNEDNVVNLGDDLAGEIAYAFALKEDDCGFNGDGTSTYGGIVGLATALADATYQVSDGGQTTYAAVTQAEISAGFRKLPAWAAQRNNIKIFCSKNAYHGIFERLAMAAGGVTAAEMANGLVAPKFFGYPVEFAQVIPVTESASATFAYIGDLAQGCYFGDRRQQTVAFSDSALNAFEQDEIAVRGTQRFDILCANVGSASAYGALVKMTL
jgi:HK97 family phage major capsid protein